MVFSDYQLFVCPCDVYCDSEHKQIYFYLVKIFYGKSLYTILNQKELGEVLHCFCKEKKTRKKKGFCDDYNCIHCKKLKYNRQCLDNAYYFSTRKDAPWQPTHWKKFLYFQINKEFKKIQKLVSDDFNFVQKLNTFRKVGQSIVMIIFNYVNMLSNFFLG